LDNAHRVNEVAERSEGFVWRHGAEDDAARAIGWPLFEDSGVMIASFSVWETPEALWQFVHKTVHGQYLRRGPEWFHKNLSYNYALWWVEPGVLPSIEEARVRVSSLQKSGPSEAVFTFKELPNVVKGVGAGA